MKSASTKFTAGFVVELHPRPVLVEASPFPLQGVVQRRDGADKSGQDVDWLVERVENRPRDLSRQQGKYVFGTKRQFQAVRERSE